MSTAVPANQYEEVQESLAHVDIYRQTPIRYLGYSNEIGEAFRSLVPRVLVNASYVLAFSYVAADTLDKTKKVYRRPFPSESSRQWKAAITAGDTFTWQLLASVAIPGFTINRVCWAAGKILARTTSLPPTVRKWTTTAIGLATIPFIVHPIDAAVELGMDKTIRTLYNDKKE